MYDNIETQRAVQNLKKQQYFVNGNTQQPSKLNTDRRNGVLKTSPPVMSARSNDGISQKDYAELFGCTFRDSHSYIWNQNEYMNMETYNDQQQKSLKGPSNQNRSQEPYFTKSKGPAVVPKRAMGDSGIRDTMLRVSTSQQNKPDLQTKRSQNSQKQNQDTKRQNQGIKIFQTTNNTNPSSKGNKGDDVAYKNLKNIVNPPQVIEIQPQSLQVLPSYKTRPKDLQLQLKTSSPLYYQFGEKQTSTYRTVKQQLAQKMPTPKSARSNLNFTRKSQKSVQSPRDQTSNDQLPSPIDDDYDSDLELLNPFIGDKDRRPNNIRYPYNHIFDLASNVSKKSPNDDSQFEPTLRQMGSQLAITIKSNKLRDVSYQERQSSCQQIPLSSRTDDNQFSQDQINRVLANSKSNKPDISYQQIHMKTTSDEQHFQQNPIQNTPRYKQNTFGGDVIEDISKPTHVSNQGSIPQSLNNPLGDETSLKRDVFTARFLEMSNPKSHRYQFSNVQDNQLNSLDVLNCQSAYLGNKSNQILEGNTQQSNMQTKSVESNIKLQGSLGFKDFDLSKFDLPKGYPISARSIPEKGITQDPDIDIQLQRILGPKRATDVLSLQKSPTRVKSSGSPQPIVLSKAIGTRLMESVSTINSQRFYSPIQNAYYSPSVASPRVENHSAGLHKHDSRICGQIQKLTQAIEELKKPLTFMADNLRAGIEQHKSNAESTSLNSNYTNQRQTLTKIFQHTFRQN